MIPLIMKLEEFRKINEISKEQAIRELDITPQYLSMIEKKGYPPGRKLAMRIVKWSKGVIEYNDLWEKKVVNRD